jgi:hypothetical protein
MIQLSWYLKLVVFLSLHLMVELHHLQMSQLDKASPIPWGLENVNLSQTITQSFVSFIGSFTGFTYIIHVQFHSFDLCHNQHITQHKC